MFVNDYVELFGYEGVLLEIKGDQVLVYCPDMDPEAPYIVTNIENIKLSRAREQVTGLLN